MVLIVHEADVIMLGALLVIVQEPASEEVKPPLEVTVTIVSTGPPVVPVGVNVRVPVA